MKKFSADMKVVRFGAEDVIVTSGVADMVFHSTMGDNTPGGNVTFDGGLYPINYDDDVSMYNLLKAIGEKYKIGTNYTKTAIVSNSGRDNLRNLLYDEINEGLGPGWVGSYMYDKDNNTFFIKQ